MYKAVLFDLDGTLLNTLEDLAFSMNETLEEMGFPTHPTLAYRYFVGEGVGELAKRVLPEKFRDAARINECIAGMLEKYKVYWNKSTSPYPGILELLERLKDQQIELAIFSNKPHAFTTMMVEHFFPNITFQMVLGVGGDIPRKPHPKGVERILSCLKIAKEDIIFLGDTKTDMETATRSGLYPVGVLWGFRERQELLQSGALALLERPRDLLPILEG